MKSTVENVVESLLACGGTRRETERRLAELAIGVVAALRQASITPEQAYDDLFNLDAYQAIKRNRLDRNLKELFEWGMEIEDVAEIAPQGLERTYKAIEKLAQRVLARSARR